MIDTGELLKLAVCPACKASLQTFTGCSRCGSVFTDVDGTPALIPLGIHRRVEFDYPANRSIATDRFKACLKYPPRSATARRELPHRLDPAHLHVIERLGRGSTILEIGCGGGQMRPWLESKGHRYIGTDISKTRVPAHLQAYGGPDLLCDAHFLPFANDLFDLVYSAALTEHLACPYLVAQEVYRALKPGGVYLGNVSFLEPWHDDSFFHMTPMGVFETLTQAEFDIDYIWPGWGYGGYRATVAMGNRFTKPLAFLGQLMHLHYQSGNRLRDLAKRLLRREVADGILDDARVAGAIDWIATRR